jgi:hypothetical protein
MAVIIKAWRVDGTPDLNNWHVRCDIPGCGHIARLVGSTSWIVPEFEAMPTFCPCCTTAMAYILIGQAITCPDCGSAAIDLYIAGSGIPATHREPNTAYCTHCGHVLALELHGDTP